MSIVAVRRATLDDALGLARVHTQSWRETYAGLVAPAALAERVIEPDTWLSWLTESDPRSAVFVAVDGSRVVGFAAVGPELRGGPSEVGQLYVIYLLAELWGRGVGHRLHAAGLAALVAGGFDSAVLWVLDSNARAIAFYTREGWRFDGHTGVEELGGDQLAELRMRRVLGQPPSSR